MIEVKGRNDKNEWITEEYLADCIKTSEQDPSRMWNLREGESNQRYYNAIYEWWATVNGKDVIVETDGDNLITACENHIIRGIEDLKSLLFKNDPEVRTHPQLGHPEDSELTDNMDALLRMSWKQASIKPSIITWGQQSSIRGLSTIKVIWNKNDNMRSKHGDIGVINVPPSDIFYDPNGTNSNRALDCRWIGHRLWKSPEFIARRWGDNGLEAANLLPKTRVGEVFDNIKKLIHSPERKTEQNNTYEIIEFWLFPTTKFDNDVTESNLKEDDYPYGVIAYTVDGRLVEIMPNPYVKNKSRQVIDINAQSSLEKIVIGHHRHPFVPMWWIRTAGIEGFNSIYNCLGAVSLMKMAQTALFSILNNTEQNVHTVANPPFLYRTDAIENPPDSIMRKPGEGIPISSSYIGESLNNAVQLLNGQQMPVDIWRFIERKTQAIKELGGIQPGMTGAYQQGSSHTPAMTVAAMQEAAFSPMWGITKELDDGLKDLAYLVLGNIQQYYEPGRYVDISENGTEIAIQLQERHLDTRFQLSVVAGATTPMYDVERESKMLNINMKVDEAITRSMQMQDPIFMETCLTYLQSIKYPPAYQYIQQLMKKIAEFEQELEQAQQIQATAGLAGLAEQQGAEQPSAGQDEGDMAIQDLETELGVPAGQLDIALSGE